MDITWNGISARYYGVIVTDISPPVRATRRVTSQQIPGRSGVLHIDDESYEPIIKTVGIGFKASTIEQIDDINGWLTGSGVLTVSTEPDRAYNAVQINGFEWERLGRRLYQASINFECEPFRYLHPESNDIVLTATGAISNPGTIWAEPLITLQGSGDITLVVGGQTVGLTDITDSITLDCAVKIAYNGSERMDNHMSGEFPRIDTGVTEIGWTGTVTAVTISPRWRYL